MSESDLEFFTKNNIEPYNTNKDLLNYNKAIWAFIIVAILVLIICFFIAKPELEWYREINKYGWLSNNWLMGVILIVVILLMSYSSYFAYCVADESGKNMVIITFTLGLLILITWFIVFFKVKSFLNAFYLSMMLFFVSFIQIYFVWDISSNAGYGMIPYIVVTFLLTIISLNISSENDFLK